MRLLVATCIVPVLGIAPGLMFLLLGYPFVALFALFQAVAVLCAVLSYGRHAADGESLSVGQGRVSLTVQDGLQSSTESWSVDAVRLWRPDAPDGDITLYAGGRPRLVGRQVPASLRRSVEAEIRRALESERAAIHDATPEHHLLPTRPPGTA